jgi:hypothetical protein
MSGVDFYCSSEENDTANASFSTADIENAYASASSPDSGGEHSGLDDDYIGLEQATVPAIIIKQEVNDEIEVVKVVTPGEKTFQRLLVESETRVGVLESELTKGVEALNIQKMESLEYLRMTKAASVTLKEEHSRYKRVAHALETRLNASDKKLHKLTRSLKETCFPPKQRSKMELQLDKTKVCCKHLGEDFSHVKKEIREKEYHRKQLLLSNRNLRAAMKANAGLAGNEIRKCLSVTKVAFATYTEHTSASLSKILWSTKVNEGKAGADIVNKIKQCLPALTLEYKTSRGLHRPGDQEITEFGEYILDTLAVMVEPKQKEIFYEPPRLDHTGKLIQPKNQLAVDPVDKVKSMAEKPLKHNAKPKVDSITRKEGRPGNVSVAKSPGVGKVKQKMGLATEDAKKVIPRVPVVIKIKSSHRSK